MDDSPHLDKPTPPPRVKKPVPLPRTNVSKNREEESACEMNEESKPKLNYTNSLRKGLKTMTGNVQEKGSAVLETTKNVGVKIERSVRGMLSKRQTVADFPNPLPGEEENKKERCNSLPSADIFNNITFDSPIACGEEEGSPTEIRTDPPKYPPPPLPDESIYDEVNSSKSSANESYYSLPGVASSFPESDSYYEEIPRLKKLSLFEVSDDSDSSTDGVAAPVSKNLERSESWKFYDSPSLPTPHNYINVTLNSNRVSLSSVDNIYSLEPKKALSEDSIKNLPKRPASLDESSKSVANDLYENWSISSNEVVDNKKLVTEERPVLKHSPSVIYEFDPLFKDEPIVANVQPSGGYSTLEELGAISVESEGEFDLNNIPPPPMRVDSLDGASKKSKSAESLLHKLQKAGCSQFFAEAEREKASKQEQNQSGSQSDKEEKKKTNIARWSSMKRAIKMVADGTPWTPLTVRKNQKEKEGRPDGAIQRPLLGAISSHSGLVLKSPSNGERNKDFVQRWCSLAEGKLSISCDKSSTPKEFVPLESIVTIQHITDRKFSVDGEEVYCWEVRGESKSTVLGCLSPSEARLWMHKTLESLTNAFPSLLASHYARSGWTYLKEGISGSWRGAWVILEKRTLYFRKEKGKLKEVDLRKARCIVIQNDVEGAGPHIMVDSHDRSLYLQFGTSKETKDWQRAIKAAATNNGPTLGDQQLTKDDIPVIVDKCINFIYAHGSMSEGIYRRSGSNSSVNKLLSELRRDAWAVQVSRQNYTEYDVASALKRFFRDLPEPLLTSELYKYFCNAANIECSTTEKVSMYRRALEKLPPVNYVTTRRLMGHLNFIHKQSGKNRMPVDNLAAIWGPTLMHVEGNGGMVWARRECGVVGELVENYNEVFMVESEEAQREERLREALERAVSAPTPPHPSGDLRLWVSIGSKDNCVNITVTPGYEAGAVSSELCGKMERGPHEVCLSEVALGGALTRPLHHSEKVLDTVLRWAYWDPNDCKNNYLLLTPNILFREIVPLAKPPFSKCGELKYADPKSKSFKTYMFEFTQAKLSYYKDKACSIKVAEWRIEDIIWYIGHEPKRNPQSRWAITFISKNNKEKRSKESPYFGHTIAGSTKDEQLQWMAALLLGEYQHTDLLPRHNLIE